MAFTPSGRIFQALFSCLWLIVNIKCQVTVPLLPSELGPNQGIPACPPLNPFAYMRDATNCGMFYRCFWGKAVPMSGCTPGLVFSNRLNICVHSGSLWDDCPVGKPAAGGKATATYDMSKVHKTTAYFPKIPYFLFHCALLCKLN